MSRGFLGHNGLILRTRTSQHPVDTSDISILPQAHKPRLPSHRVYQQTKWVRTMLLSRLGSFYRISSTAPDLLYSDAFVICCSSPNWWATGNMLPTVFYGGADCPHIQSFGRQHFFKKFLMSGGLCYLFQWKQNMSMLGDRLGRATLWGYHKILHNPFHTYANIKQFILIKTFIIGFHLSCNTHQPLGQLFV